MGWGRGLALINQGAFDAGDGVPDAFLFSSLEGEQDDVLTEVEAPGHSECQGGLVILADVFPPDGVTFEGEDMTGVVGVDGYFFADQPGAADFGFRMEDGNEPAECVRGELVGEEAVFFGDIPAFGTCLLVQAYHVVVCVEQGFGIGVASAAAQGDDHAVEAIGTIGGIQGDGTAHEAEAEGAVGVQFDAGEGVERGGVIGKAAGVFGVKRAGVFQPAHAFAQKGQTPKFLGVQRLAGLMAGVDLIKLAGERAGLSGLGRPIAEKLPSQVPGDAQRGVRC